MNVHEGLDQSMKYISMFNGVCLNIQENCRLEIAFNKLHEEIKAEQLHFWGKIIGTERDYYIAKTLNFTDKYQEPEKKFYWCLSNNFATYQAFVFQELPETFADHLVDVQKVNGYFKGNPDEIHEKYLKEVEPGEEGGAEKIEETTKVEKDELQLLEEEEERAKNPIIEKRNFTELGRLSFVIRQIDHDTSVFPEGAYKMLPIHELRVNNNFHGLAKEDLLNLSKYQHLRNVITPEKKELIEKDDVIFQFNFYDSLSQDPVKKCWSTQLDPTKTIVNLRSLLWPGYFSYHKANTNKFGGVYIGYGMKNSELPFMNNSISQK